MKSALEPSTGKDYYSILLTRPTPIPPADLELAVMEVGHLRVPAGDIFPETMPLFCTIAWCVEGSFSLVGRGWKTTAPAGSFAVMGPDQYVTTNTANGCEAYYLLLDGPQMVNTISRCGLWEGCFPYQQLPVQWLEYIGQHIHDISLQATLANTGMALFLDAARQAERGAKDQLVWRACRYLNENWHKAETCVETVLKHLNVSRSSLSTRFKNETGSTLGDYLAHIRIYHATRKLSNEQLPIRQIASQCGFPDAAHFSKWFKKQTGKSPRDMKLKKGY